MDKSWAVYVVIPVFNGWDKTRICLDALANSNAGGVKVIVVDHGSTDGTPEHLTRLYPQVRRIGGLPTLWWTGATNLGIKAAIDDGATHVILLNNDSYVEKNTIATLLRHASQSPDTVVAPVQKNIEDDSVFVPAATTCFLLGFSTLLFPRLFHRKGEQENTLRAPMIMGARGVLVPKTIIDRVGLFDESALPHYGADHDFYLRCRKKGIPLLIATDATILIDNSKTTLAKDYANMSVRDFFATLKDRRSHRNIRDLSSLFRLHYPIKSLYWIGVGLNLARHATWFILRKSQRYGQELVAARRRSAKDKGSSNK
jgi:GT2 family glycosyltransferase